MLALRLARGTRPLGLIGRLLVACAAAGVGFLLLAALSYALAHPGRSSDAARLLLWCLVPLAAAVQFATAVACTEPGMTSRSALDAAGMGPSRLPVLAAVSTAVACLLGSVVALLVYLHLRGDLTGLPFDGAGVELLAAGRPLPVAAALTLLCLVPAIAAVAAALTMRARAGDAARDVRSVVPAGSDEDGGEAARQDTGAARHPAGIAARPRPVTETAETPRVPHPTALPWGVASTAVGLALETYAGRDVPGSAAGLPGGAAVGILLSGLGLVLAGPGLVHLAGRLLTLRSPGALRLLAGRALQQDAGRIGRPLGVLAAVAACGLALSEIHDAGVRSGLQDTGPLPALGAAVVVSCAVASALAAAAETHTVRTPSTAALVRIGASRQQLLGAAALRVGVLAVVLGAPAWIIGMLAALPLT